MTPPAGVRYCGIAGCDTFAAIIIGHTSNTLHMCRAHAREFREADVATQRGMLRNRQPPRGANPSARHVLLTVEDRHDTPPMRVSR